MISIRQGTAISDDRERDHAAGGDIIAHACLGRHTSDLPNRPRYPEFPRASKLAHQVLQLLATKISVMMRCPEAAHASEQQRRELTV